MIRFQLRGLIVALLAGFLPSFCEAQAPTGQVFNMDFIFGFYPESIPTEDPTEAQLSALICDTQVVLAQLLQDTSNNPTVTMEAKDIAFVRPYNGTQFLMTFWGNYSTAPGGRVPTTEEINAALDGENINFNKSNYILYTVNVATPLDGGPAYFAEVNSMSYNGSYGPVRPGTLAEATCAATIAPTLIPPANETMAPGNETDPEGGTPAVNGTEPDAGGPPGGNGTNPNSDNPGPGDNSTGTDPTSAPGGNGTDPDGPGPGGPGAGVNGTDPDGGGPGGNGTDPNGGGLGAGGNGTDPNGGGLGAGGNGTGPDGGGPGASGNGTNPGGNGTNPGGNGTDVGGGGTNPPTMTASAPDTLGMVYSVIEIGFFEEWTLREPTDVEVKELICKTNLFFRDEIRNVTGNATIQSEATNINWVWNPAVEPYPFVMSFTSNVTYDFDEPVDGQVVYNAMMVDEPNILSYIEFYVQAVPTGNAFIEANRANFTNERYMPVPIGKLPTYQCPTTQAPSMMPSVSSAPTSSKSPSAVPTASAEPTSSFAPSMAPSVSSAPSPAPTDITAPPALLGGGGGTPGGPTKKPTPLFPTISSIPTTSAAPTNSPTVSAAPTITPRPSLPGGGYPGEGGPGGSGSGGVGGDGAKRQRITTKYYVSNDMDITNPSEANASGLSGAWPVFASKVVTNITNAGNRRRLRSGSRRLQVGLEPGTATIDELVLVSCPRGAQVNTVCMNATSSYVLLLRGNENASAVEQEYGSGTIAAVDDGSYQAVLDEVKPDSPLTIGIIPEAEEGEGGLPLWLLILIILLALLCCCCCLLALFFLMQKRDKGDKALEPYDEEGFVYDFLIPANQKPQTEVDDEATKAVELDDDGDEDDDKEEFLDDDKPNQSRAGVPPPPESVALIEAESFDDDDKDDDFDEDEDDDEDLATRKVEEDDEDETTPLVPVNDTKEEPPLMQLEAAKRDPDQEFGDRDEADGMRASDLQDIDGDLDGDDDDGGDDDDDDDDVRGKKDEHWDDEPPTDSEAGRSAKDEETSQEGGEERGDDGDWGDDDGDKDAKLVDKDDDDDDDDGDNEKNDSNGDEEWDEDEKDGAGGDDGWEDDGDGDGDDDSGKDGWDDEDDDKPVKK